jgi:hypothetical protein
MRFKPTLAQKELLIQDNPVKKEGVIRAAVHIGVDRDRKSSNYINSTRLKLMVLARKIAFLF